MDRRQFLSRSIGFALVSWAPLVFAQSGPLFTYKLKSAAQTDTGAPAFTLSANQFVTNVEVTMRRSDGEVVVTKIGTMRPGRSRVIPFKQPKGSFGYRIEITGSAGGDEIINAALETRVHYLDPIKLKIDKNSVRLTEGTLALTTNVALERVDVEVFSKSGKKIGEHTDVIGGRDGSISISWPPTSHEIGSLKLTATDIGGFWAKVRLEPFFVEIPHEDVVFDTGKSTWHASEEPKLKATVRKVQAVLRQNKDRGLEMSMYVAGYADTVGDPKANLELSVARARAIGEWFSEQNLRMEVYVQGFGESVLAVNTPESVDEPRNRRAVYIVGNTPPPISAQIPYANWKRV